MTIDSPTSPRRRSWPRRLLNRLEVDQAVFFAVAVRGWQLLAGPVVLLLMARHFSAEAQGYYFTFASLLGLSMFVELGLRVVVLNLSSHEWAVLGLDRAGRIVGDAAARSRLVSLGQRTIVWFLAAAAVFAAVIGGAGFAFFRANDATAAVSWEAPWWSLVGVTALQLALSPALAILDGCRQMTVVNRFRFGQALTASFTAFAWIIAGGELWTAVAMAVVRLFWDVWVVAVRYRAFFAAFVRPPEGPRIDWREEVLPLQWRLAVQSALAWFSNYVFAPVLFHYHGAPEAGRFGITWAALTALQSGAVAWVDTRAPLFGVLIARRDYRELDRVFFRVCAVSLVLLGLGMSALCAAVAGLYALGRPGSEAVSPSASWAIAAAERFSHRILPPVPTLLFAAGLWLYTVTHDLTAYLLAHKKNPLLLACVAAHTLVGGAVWLLGSRYGAVGAGAGYLAVEAGFAVPCWTFIWLRCRRDWHRGGPLRAC